MAYFIVVILIILFIYELEVYVDVLIAIKGAVFGFLVVYLIPVWVHLKCVFYDQTSGFVEGEH